MRVNYTPEEQQHLSGIFDKYRDQLETATGEARTQLIIQQQEELDAYFDACEQKRFDELGKDPEKILENARQSVFDLVKWRYEALAGQYPAEDLVQLGIAEEQDGVLRIADLVMVEMLRDELRLHIDALKDDKPRLYLVYEAIAEAATSTQYTFSAEKPTLSQSSIYDLSAPMYRGKGTLALAGFTGATPAINKLAKQATYQVEGFTITLPVTNAVSFIAADKLHRTLITEFTRLNRFGKKLNLEMHIPFMAYVRAMDADIDPHPTDSPEAAEKEKKRVKEALKSARKKIMQTLDVLRFANCEWTERVNGRVTEWGGNILQDRGIDRGYDGYIRATFGQKFANYLLSLPESQSHTGLIGIDERKPNAYFIASKMVDHYNMDSNKKRGTANRLKISTLLSVTNLPTWKDLQSDNDTRHWERRIKDPFENALNDITIILDGYTGDLSEIKGKVLTNWEYVKPGGAPLSDAEAAAITDYETFADLLVQFEILETPEHKAQTTARIERQAEEKKQANRKKRSGK